MLKVNGVDNFYGKVQVLHDLSIQVGEQSIVSIIGANGAGKTTLMKTIVGALKPNKGNIQFCSKDITKLPTHKIVLEGITYVPEGRKIFPELTVQENLEMGAYVRKGLSKTQLNNELEELYDIFPRLKERIKQLGGTLSGGEQQMLAIARGLMRQPKLLMLDEPSLGLAPIIVDEVFSAITRINKERKLPILLVEQNAYAAMEISDFTYVLELGRITQSGKSQDLLHSEEIINAYLGGRVN